VQGFFSALIKELTARVLPRSPAFEYNIQANDYHFSGGSMQLPNLKAGFVGFGEVNSPRDLIERKCQSAQSALEALGLELVATAPVSDDPAGRDEARARQELSRADFDLLVICLAGWIPSHSVVDVIAPFSHKPMVLWGLTGYYEGGRLVTTADQAGTTALRDTLESLGCQFIYVYDTPDAPYAAANQVHEYARVVRAAALLRQSRVGMMGYRDMKLYATLVDGVSLRRVVGAEVEIFETLEIAQRMPEQDPAEVAAIADHLIREWQCCGPETGPCGRLTPQVLDPSIRLYLAVMERVRERGYQAVSLIDVDGVKKLLHFTPAAAMMMLADLGGLATIPENDGLGAVTQLIVRYLTRQVGAYFEFYEFFSDRLLVGVPDYVPAEVVDGPVQVRLTAFGQFSEGILNVSPVKTGRVTLCRLASRGDRYRMHIVTGQALKPRPWEEAGWTPPAPQLPSLEVVLDTPVTDFAQKVLGQHYILAYGDQRGLLEALCRLLKIEII
jgi:L-fucose isomerase-like protein